MRIVKLFLTRARFPIDNLLSPVNLFISTTQSDFHLRSFTLSPLKLINTERSSCVPGPPWGSRIQPICLSGVNVEAMSRVDKLAGDDPAQQKGNTGNRSTSGEREILHTSETHELICVRPASAPFTVPVHVPWCAAEPVWYKSLQLRITSSSC